MNAGVGLFRVSFHQDITALEISTDRIHVVILSFGFAFTRAGMLIKGLQILEFACPFFFKLPWLQS